MAFYRCMGGNGGGTTPTSITPSNSSPAAMSSGGVYQPTANGYAIESYDSKTPSDSTPPTVSSGDIVKMGGAGYLYETQFPDFAGAPDVNWYNMTAGSSGTASITVTQKPRYIICAITSRNSNYSFRTIFIDVENNKGWAIGSDSATAKNEDFSSKISTLFPTISASSVVYSYVLWGANHRVNIGIYY